MLILFWPLLGLVDFEVPVVDSVWLEGFVAGDGVGVFGGGGEFVVA